MHGASVDPEDGFLAELASKGDDAGLVGDDAEAWLGVREVM
jgi:hypothetical protein